MRRLFAGVAAILCATAASAQDVAGDFDFYVLALSWSPTYCLLEGSPEESQCAVERHGFILHGLWPQYERGYPEYCRGGASNRVSNNAIGSVIDIMPSPGLIRHQWRKHGVCAGLSERAYFRLLREAFEEISIPDDYVSPDGAARRSPASIETDFLAANPGLRAGGLAVTCKEGHLADVRICLTKALEFRDCREVDRDTCRASRIDAPAVR